MPIILWAVLFPLLCSVEKNRLVNVKGAYYYIALYISVQPLSDFPQQMLTKGTAQGEKWHGVASQKVERKLRAASDNGNPTSDRAAFLQHITTTSITLHSPLKVETDLKQHLHPSHALPSPTVENIYMRALVDSRNQ